MPEKSSAIWNKCLQIIASQINPQSFRTWFDGTEGIGSNENAILVTVKSQFVAEWLAANYAEAIANAAVSAAGEQVEVFLQYRRDTEIISVPICASNDPKTQNDAERSQFNSKYTFDTFVVGDFNRLSFMAAMAVAESPGKTKYNPLYIHGGVGLGKTHLLQAIGQFVKQNYPQKIVRYVSAERFTDRFINSLIAHTTSRFREYYRSAHVLLIDDVQSFSGKEGVQKEFFHIFNALHQSGQQIVITSDVPPSEIRGFEDRLISRFNWGLTVDMQPPEFESRVAILRKKAEADGLEMPENILSLIAQTVTSNIRELEGALIRLLAYSSIRGRDISEDLVLEVIGKPQFSPAKAIVTLEDILKGVSDYMGVSVEQLRGQKRTKRIALARQIAMYLARNLTGCSLQHIGQFFGGRDHSTVVHACKTIPEKQGEVQRLLDRITANLTR